MLILTWVGIIFVIILHRAVAIWPCGFRGEDFLEIDQSEIRIACGGHVC
jgi:hypothetical protein